VLVLGMTNIKPEDNPSNVEDCCNQIDNLQKDLQRLHELLKRVSECFVEIGDITTLLSGQLEGLRDSL